MKKVIPRFFSYTALKLLMTLMVITSSSAKAEGPPLTSSGKIGSDTLVQNKNLANVQAAGAVATFLGKGTQTCDAEGKNCRSLFGADDSLDFVTAQRTAQSLTGIDGLSFASGSGSTNVSTQSGSVAFACDDLKIQKIAGLAFKPLSCSVTTAGATLTYRICTAPSRGLPIEQPENAVVCSTDATAPDYKAPAGKVCKVAACDSEPIGAQNGWSLVKTAVWDAAAAKTNAPEVEAKNGMAMVFYPDLANGVVPSFSANSETMTVVKIVEASYNATTRRSAVAVKVAYRFTNKITKAQLESASAIPNPRDYTTGWDTVTKLQADPMIPQFQQKYGQQSSECLTKLQEGLSTDGKIAVCDETYTNESGIKPLARTAQVAAEGAACSTTEQCLQEVVNTNSWTQTCISDAPLSSRNCQTTTASTLNELIFKRTRTVEVCHEKRASAQYACTTTYSMTGSGCTPGEPCARVPTCNVGQAYSINLMGSTGMNGDYFKGGDYLNANWVCTLDDYPSVTMITNGRWSEISAVVPTNSTALVNNGIGQIAQFSNSTVCNNGQCTGTYVMALGVVEPQYNYNLATKPGCGAESGLTDNGAAIGSGAAGFGYYQTTPICTGYREEVYCSESTYENCSVPIVSRNFIERSFGAASRITAAGNFSMATMRGISIVSNSCSAYESAK